MNIDIDKLWLYNYKVKYYNYDLGERVTCSGVVLAEDTADVYSKLTRYYLNPSSDEDFDSVTIECREFGDIAPSLVIEFGGEDLL